ncbi:MAG: hypothetical protein GKR92_08485 [Gammaproteobacteria bacterium]|nr:MAG: hypothetical protein GKR92_08485 [Gammaproteobacteria bacterium]
MENPYSAPKSQDKNRRDFKTPIIVPVSVVMVLTIYVGYWIFTLNGGVETGLLASLKGAAFELFLVSETCMIAIILYGKKKLETFLHDHPVIENGVALEILKPIARENMYSALILFFFLGLGSLTAIMTLLNNGIIDCIVVVILGIVTAVLIRIYTPIEESIKQIECTDETLENELSNLLNCWMNKAFPNF